MNHLAKSGSRVILPARCSENHRQHLKPMGDLGQIVQFDYSVRDEEAIKYAVERANVVINLIGESGRRNFSLTISIETGRRLAEACKESATVKRLIHVSALGDKFGREIEVLSLESGRGRGSKEIFPGATIVKPG